MWSYYFCMNMSVYLSLIVCKFCFKTIYMIEILIFSQYEVIKI